MDLRESSLGFYRVWHVAWGQRAGLLAALAGAPRSEASLARVLRLERGALGRWLRGAEALGLVERARGGWRIPRGARGALGPPGRAESLVAHFDYLAAKSADFPDVVGLMRGESRRRPLQEVYAIATAWDHGAFFDLLLPREPTLRAALRRGADVLDLGCGLGGWSLELARRFPRCRVVGADVDAAALRAARRAARGARNVRIVHASDVPASRFDLAFLGEVLGAARSPQALADAAARALRPSASLVAIEGLHEPRGRTLRGWDEKLVPAMGTDFALDGSRFLDRDEALGVLRRAGLVACRARRLGGGVYALRARRGVRGLKARVAGAHA